MFLIQGRVQVYGSSDPEGPPYIHPDVDVVSAVNSIGRGGQAAMRSAHAPRKRLGSSAFLSHRPLDSRLTPL